MFEIFFINHTMVLPRTGFLYNNKLVMAGDTCESLHMIIGKTYTFTAVTIIE